MIPPDPVASGRDVRFDPPAWALSECTTPITTPMRVRRAGTFEDMWERGLLAIEDRLRQGVWRWPEKPTGPEEALQAKLRERLATKAEGTVFDTELEAYTLALVRHTDFSLFELSALRPRALAYWTTRSDPATALETLVRGMCTSCFARQAYSTLRALHGEPTLNIYLLPEVVRDHVRQHGVTTLEPVVRRLCDDPLVLAWILDDEAAALDEVRRHDHPARGLERLVGLLPTAEDAAPLLEAAPLGDGMRAIARHGAALAGAALASTPASKAHITFWACYPSATAAHKLVDALGPKQTRSLVAQALANMPEHAHRALLEARANRTPHRDVIDALLSTFEAQVAPEACVDRGAGDAPESDLPQVLVSPPWRTKRRAALPAFAGLVARPVEYAVDLRALDPRVLERELTTLTSLQRERPHDDGRVIGAYMVWGATFEQLEALRATGALARVDAHY